VRPYQILGCASLVEAHRSSLIKYACLSALSLVEIVGFYDLILQPRMRSALAYRVRYSGANVSLQEMTPLGHSRLHRHMVRSDTGAGCIKPCNLTLNGASATIEQCA
jgi:hypothetical protein